MNQAYLFNNGTNVQSHMMLGAMPGTSAEGEHGFHFAVWAPHAKAVSVVGDFNFWNEQANPLRAYGTTGIWLGFVPDALPFERYKYSIETRRGQRILKADPFARHAETRPGTSSVLYDYREDYAWRDGAYLATRQPPDVAAPLNIYEMHIGSWRRYPDGNVYSYREVAMQLPEYLLDMGYNAVEFMPLTEYPLDASWGYQVSGFFAATSRYGTPADLKFLVDELHKAGIKVIFDLVLGHFPKDAFGLARFDGEPLYEHPDTRIGEHDQWGTLVFNYGLAEVRSFLLSAIAFWIEEFHADGLRLDAVTSMIYLSYGRDDAVTNVYGGDENIDAVTFLREANDMVKARHPNVLMIAEESTAWPNITKPTAEGGLGFDYKWNMGWMNDTLRYMKHDYYARRNVHELITFSMTYAFSERFMLPFSHDEVVHGKSSILGRMPGDYWRQFASMRTLFMYQFGHPGAKLNFMGNEMAPYLEWRFYEELEWFMLQYEQHAKMKAFVRDLNHLYLDTAALWQIDNNWDGFSWIAVDDHANSVFAFKRMGIEPADQLLIVLNMTPATFATYRLVVDAPGTYTICLNSDDAQYGGSDYLANNDLARVFVTVESTEEAGSHYLDIPVPPLGGLYLTYEPLRETEALDLHE